MRGVVYDGERVEVVDDLDVRDPGPGEVQVAISAAGLCHSDLSVVERDIALYAELYRAGRLLLDELVTQTYPVEAFDKAAEDAREGRVARAVLMF